MNVNLNSENSIMKMTGVFLCDTCVIPLTGTPEYRYDCLYSKRERDKNFKLVKEKNETISL